MTNMHLVSLVDHEQVMKISQIIQLIFPYPPLATGECIMSASTTQTSPPSVPSSPRLLLRYAPPWPELSPRADYWYWRLEQVLSAILWAGKKTGRIEDYAFADVLGPCFETWPESLDGRHIGAYSIKDAPSTRFFKVGRLIVILNSPRIAPHSLALSITYRK